MTRVTKKTWNAERVVLILTEGEFIVRAKIQGRSVEFKMPDAGISDKLGEPSSTTTEGVL